MNYCDKFIVEPGKKIKIAKINPNFSGKYSSRKEVASKIEKNLERMTHLQYLLYADGRKSLLVVLQSLDAGGKDGVIRKVFTGLNPLGTHVSSFKQPAPVELAHDFLWRVHQCTPAKGEVGIFNRSHYEDVLVVRVHKLVPKSVWSERYELINDFERTLTDHGTRIIKFYLHISPEEQLERFKERLDNPTRQWKISESDYSERELWPKYREAFEEAIERTTTKHAPWFVIPANRKWFRDLAVSDIIVQTLEEMDLKTPPPQVDIAEIRRKYHEAKKEEKALDRKLR